jgi:hypothetical protein
MVRLAAIKEQPRDLGASTNSMAPAAFVDLGVEATRHPRRVAVIGRVASRAGSTRSTPDACVRVFPRLLRVALADPAAVFAGRAFHRIGLSN